MIVKTKNIRNLTSEDVVYDLWILLSRTNHALSKARQKELDQYGISVREAGVLFHIGFLGNKATPTEISRWLLQEPHSISELLSRMERRGFVRKVKDLDRRNLVRVEMTQKGKEARENALKRDSIHWMLAALTAEERERMRKFLVILRDKALDYLRNGQPR